MKPLLAILYLALAVGHACGAEEIAGTGASGFPCAQFTLASKTVPSPAESGYIGWAQGFMSGINFALISGKQPWFNLGTKSLDEQKAWLRSFCERNPAVPFGSAVMDLLVSFPKVPHRPN